MNLDRKMCLLPVLVSWCSGGEAQSCSCFSPVEDKRHGGALSNGGSM